MPFECLYCSFSTSSYSSVIDHVVGGTSRHKRFFVTPRNVALCCKICRFVSELDELLIVQTEEESEDYFGAPLNLVCQSCFHRCYNSSDKLKITDLKQHGFLSKLSTLISNTNDADLFILPKDENEELEIPPGLHDDDSFKASQEYDAQRSSNSDKNPKDSEKESIEADSDENDLKMGILWQLRLKVIKKKV